MNIGVDCRPFVNQLTGIGSFDRNVVDSLIRNIENCTIFLFAPEDFHQSLERDYEKNKNVKVIKSPFISKRVPRIVWYIFKMSMLIRKYKITHFIATKTELPFIISKRVKTVSLVYDVVNIEYATTMGFANRLMMNLFYNRAINNSNLLWCISHYTKGKIKQYFPEVPEDRLFVGGSVDTNLFKMLGITQNDKKMILDKQGITSSKTLLFVGSLEPRKNLGFLLDIMPDLYKQGIQLLVVGARGWKNSDIKDIVNSPDFPKESTIFCGYLTNKELVELYNSVDCYVSTSKNEGLGMPQLEAMYCGCPVISPNNSAMTEVLEGRGTLVDGWDKQVWIDTITYVLDHPKKKEVNLRDYDWDVIIKRFANKFLN